MKRSVHLVNGSSRELVEGELIRHISPDRLLEIEAAWALARQWSLFHPLTAADWNWGAKRDAAVSGTAILVELTCLGSPQGAMKVDAAPHAARLDPAKTILYVEYLESAPWNIRFPGKATEPQFMGVGLILVSEAIRLSHDFGHNGRIGLHALANAEQFYRNKCRFTEIGADIGENGLIYFECTEMQATELLEKIGLE